MIDPIEDRRRIEFQLDDYGKSWIFDYQGNNLSAQPFPEELAGLGRILSKLCESEPCVSGIAARNISYGGRQLSAQVRRYIDLTLGELFAMQARAMPDQESIVDIWQDKRFTFAQINELSDNLAKALIKLGVERLEHVAVIMDNCWENLTAKIALTKIGAVIVNLNQHEKANIIELLLKRSDVATVIVKHGRLKADPMGVLCEICPEINHVENQDKNCAALPKLKRIIDAAAGEKQPFAFSFNELISEGAKQADCQLQERMRKASPFDLATIIHTSGTSGTPKGVMLKHYQIIENTLAHVRYLGLTCKDRYCSTAPMFHSLGIIGSTATTALAGATLICIDQPKKCENLLTTLIRERCTVLCSVPTIFIILIDLIKSGKGDKNKLSLRLCLTAGAPCPKQMLLDMRDILGAKSVITMYGMTEASPGITSTALDDPVEVVVSTCGRLWPGVAAKICDPLTGDVLETGQIGEICIHGYGVTEGYYKMPEETKKTIDSEGWLHTGDLGYFSEDGLLFLKGRCKDLIIRGGENISPLEIESFLRLHKDVDDAAVVGVPDEKYGEVAFAFIKLKSGATTSGEELKEWCKGKIATIKIPRYIALLKDLPVSDTGKVDKKILRKLAKEGYGKLKSFCPT